MANLSVTPSLQTIDFRKDFFREWVRKNRLSAYSGRGVNNAIVQKLGRGPTLRHPLVTRLLGAGVAGSATARGNGESIGNYSWDTNPTYHRHSVEFDREELEKTNLQLMTVARPLLMEWAMGATRDKQIKAFAAVYDGTTYAELDANDLKGTVAATETIKDAWLVANLERTIFGDNQGSGTDHSSDLATIDATNDKMVRGRVSDMRRKAEDADPHIHPYQTDEEGEVYVLFAGTVAVRDLKADLETINQNADVRGMKITSNGNILARDGDMFYDGVIIRKVPEIGKLLSGSGKSLENAGASGTTRVEAAFLCGAQALVHGMGQAPRIIVDRAFDYEFQPGVLVEMKEDIKKTFFNGNQHGVITGYFSGVI